VSTLPTLDSTDIAILNQLQEDGRRSFTVIARTLNMSIGAVRNRVTRLIEQGTLRVVGKVDPSHVGWNAPATIEIATRPGTAPQIIAALTAHPEVTYVASISGEYDLMIDVMCRDNVHFHSWLHQVLYALDGVERVRTIIILKVHKYASTEITLSDLYEE
jgi:Lrp/AsnC family transcriptional regulator for asnA, asnC and gidA